VHATSSLDETLLSGRGGGDAETRASPPGAIFGINVSVAEPVDFNASTSSSL
jgi:hypothetical protein